MPLCDNMARGTNLDLPSEQRWLLLPLAAALFVYNFALVSAYGLAANAGFVRAFATIEMVLLTLVLAGEAWYRELPVDLPWWKVVGVALCFGGGGARCPPLTAVAPNQALHLTAAQSGGRR